MAGNEERRTDQCERSCRECLEARFVDIMHEHVPVFVRAAATMCMFSAHELVCTHVHLCVKSSKPTCAE